MATDLLRAVPVTLELALLAIGGSSLIALPLGTLSALRPERPLDYAGLADVFIKSR